MMDHIVMDNFTLHDSLFVPKGTTVALAVDRVHFNPDIYEDPEIFEPFQFINMKIHSKQHPTQLPMTSTMLPSTKKFNIVLTSCDFLSFGHGWHACPGCYFATCELKLMLVHVAMNYDIKLEKEGVRPVDFWIATVRAPNHAVEVLFRKQRAEWTCFHIAKAYL